MTRDLTNNNTFHHLFCWTVPMIRTCSIPLAALAALILAHSANASLLVDGNLSLATSGSLTSNSPWALIATLPDGTNRAAQFQTGFANAQNTGVGGTEPPGTGTGVWLRSFEGNQGGSGEPLAQAVLTQSIVAPIDGDYTLEFVAGREVNFIAREFNVTLSTLGQSSTVDLLTAVIPDGNLGGAASGNPGGTPFTLSLSGVTAGELVTVTGVMLDGRDSQIPGGQSGFLDGFVLTAVPEPTAAMLCGLGLSVFISRRRRA